MNVTVVRGSVDRLDAHCGRNRGIGRGFRGRHALAPGFHLRDDSFLIDHDDFVARLHLTEIRHGRSSLNNQPGAVFTGQCDTPIALADRLDRGDNLYGASTFVASWLLRDRCDRSACQSNHDCILEYRKHHVVKRPQLHRTSRLEPARQSGPYQTGGWLLRPQVRDPSRPLPTGTPPGEPV